VFSRYRRSPIHLLRGIGEKMKTPSKRRIDLRYPGLDERKQQIINKRLSEDLVLEIGKDERILGIEITGASKSLYLENLLRLPDEMASLRHYHG
jgi:uncharacterized protein YuzE